MPEIRSSNRKVNVAREIADVTISADNLLELARLRALSKLLMHRIRANYRFVIAFNGGLIALGAMGILSPSTLALSVYSMTNLLANCYDGKEKSASAKQQTH